MQNIVLWIAKEEGSKKGFKFKFTGSLDKPKKYLRFQIENSLRLGWNKEDLIVITNFPFSHQGVEAHIATDICQWSSFVNKLVSINEMIAKGVVNDDFWLHDCDAYQVEPFDFPSECKDWGYTRHNPSRSKMQGGSGFYRKSAYDIVDTIAKMIKIHQPIQEEAFFPMFYAPKGHKWRSRILQSRDKYRRLCEEENDAKLKRQYQLKAEKNERALEGSENYGKFASRFSFLDYTYNMAIGKFFVKKYSRATKPIKVLHFPSEGGDNNSFFRSYYWGENPLNVRLIPDEMGDLFLKHDFIQTKR